MSLKIGKLESKRITKGKRVQFISALIIDILPFFRVNLEIIYLLAALAVNSKSVGLMLWGPSSS